MSVFIFWLLSSRHFQTSKSHLEDENKNFGRPETFSNPARHASRIPLGSLLAYEDSQIGNVPILTETLSAVVRVDGVLAVVVCG